jgi:hypothetical protein
MKNIFGPFLLSVFLGMVLYLPIIAQERNSITGFVFNDARAPVGNIYVELQTDYYSTVSRMQTRGSGQFNFGGLPAGLYYVKVLTSGTDYEEQIRSVSLVPMSVVQGRGSATEHVIFYLKPKKNRSAGRTAAPAVVFAQDIPAESQSLYSAALEDLTAKNDTAAFDKLKRSIEIFPDFYLALDRLGNEYVLRGHYEAGAILLAKALTVNKRSDSSAFGLGLGLFRLGHIDSALDQFENVVKLDPESANGHLWMGITLHAKKRFPDALRSLQKANEISNGTSAEVHWQLARVYKDQNRFDRAAEELELFLKYNPEAKNAAEIKEIIASLRKK